MLQRRHADSARAGFSLIELLAVMVILSILMTFLAFRLGALGGAAKQETTRSFLQQIALAANTYETEMGDYPASSWKAEWGPTPNKQNIGGEALCVQLWSKDYGGSGISDDKLINMDEDEAKKSLTTHGNNNLFELKDAWDNPIAYFHRQDYDREDVYLTLDEQDTLDTSNVKAVKNPKTGNYFNPRSYQLISPGEDGLFGTKDDLYNFEVERED